ncbi:hypothetical protein PMAYCL1PPCAC_32008 [Pristionchus mayeri]|uniref:Chromo domain-containing protein n=1 Tax=Pristionchus mayeri TaxID=1317129 RepID=A0AAN5ID28_9BILA|nr:hypothetical protein PMAYCL1PPCAC_32008 [Pristionchus mayeri]
MAETASLSAPSTTSMRKWIVSKLVSHRILAPDKMEFLVQWEGFNRRFDSWEPFENVQPATASLHEYYRAISEEEVKKIKTCRLMMKRAARAKREEEARETGETPKKKKRKTEEGVWTPKGDVKKIKLATSSERKGKERKEQDASTPSDVSGSESTPTKKKATKALGEKGDTSASPLASPLSTPTSTKKNTSKIVEVETASGTIGGALKEFTTPVSAATENLTPKEEKSTEKKKRGRPPSKKSPIGVSQTGMTEELDAEEKEKESAEKAEIREKLEADQLEVERKDEDEECEEMLKNVEDVNVEEKETSASVETSDESNDAILSSKKRDGVIPVTVIQSEWTEAYRNKIELPMMDESENPRIPVAGMELGTVLSEDEEEIIVLRAGERVCQRPPMLERRSRNKKYMRRRKPTCPERITIETNDAGIAKKKKRAGAKRQKHTGARSPDAASLVLNSAPAVIVAPQIAEEVKMKKLSKMEQLTNDLLEKKRQVEGINKKEERAESKTDEIDDKVEDDGEKDNVSVHRDEGKEKEDETAHAHLPSDFDEMKCQVQKLDGANIDDDNDEEREVKEASLSIYSPNKMEAESSEKMDLTEIESSANEALDDAKMSSKESRESSEESQILMPEYEMRDISNDQEDLPRSRTPSPVLPSDVINERDNIYAPIPEEQREIKEELMSEGEEQSGRIEERRTSRTVKKKQVFSPSR